MAKRPKAPKVIKLNMAAIKRCLAQWKREDNRRTQ